MPGCFIYIWLCFFTVFVRETEVKEVQMGLYSRVELTGEELDQQTVDSLRSVEWTKRIGSVTCLCFKKNTTFSAEYSQCCGRAHFYLNNNSLILENVTAKDEGVYTETIIRGKGTTKSQNFTLLIQYPPSVTEIVVSWTSNTSVTLKCEVSGVFLHLMWKREGLPVLEKHRHSFSERNQTLHISNITSSDYETYSCIASNEYGESEQHTYITGENSTDNRGNSAAGQIVLSSGLTLAGVLGLFIVFFCLYKNHQRDADKVHGVYQEVPDTEEVTFSLYICTDLITSKEPSQASFEDYSAVGPTCREETVTLYWVTNDQSTSCTDAGYDK
ncbi:fibroblast growth factor receptor 1 isoform X6 [Carassius gibelio]|uniref:fibroblast growth factor receptor 1 isoform X6 n=1 Tax=Carassius gibelio TaxID=101364 RepID=UPI0022785B8C|nr:fibroblast growth factor receptor 1 isoform X6 [Carassius gibelio]